MMQPLLLVNHDCVVITSMTGKCSVASLNEPDTAPINLLADVKSGDDKKDRDSEAKGLVLAGAFSRDGKYLAITNDYKQVLLFSTPSESGPSAWKLVSTRDTPKKGMKIVFNSDNSAFFMADKFGDVQRFSVTEAENEGEVICGHLSMLLDLCFLQDGKYLVTCDRDEKIRVSHYPNTYNIQSFCLGHRKYVTGVAEAGNLLVSASGDGTVKLWRPLDGVCISTYDIATKGVFVKQIVYSEGQVYCLLSGQDEVLVLSVSGDEPIFQPVETLTLQGIPLHMHASNGTVIVLQNNITCPLFIREGHAVRNDVPFNSHLTDMWPELEAGSPFQAKFYENLEKMNFENSEEFMEKKGKRAKLENKSANGDKVIIEDS